MNIELVAGIDLVAGFCGLVYIASVRARVVLDLIILSLLYYMYFTPACFHRPVEPSCFFSTNMFWLRAWMMGQYQIRSEPFICSCTPNLLKLFPHCACCCVEKHFMQVLTSRAPCIHLFIIVFFSPYSTPANTHHFFHARGKFSYKRTRAKHFS